MGGESLGAVAILGMSVDEINIALARLQEGLDALKGLRGPIRVFARSTAAAFTVQDDTGMTIHAFGSPT